MEDLWVENFLVVPTRHESMTWHRAELCCARISSMKNPTSRRQKATAALIFSTTVRTYVLNVLEVVIVLSQRWELILELIVSARISRRSSGRINPWMHWAGMDIMTDMTAEEQDSLRLQMFSDLQLSLSTWQTKFGDFVEPERPLSELQRTSHLFAFWWQSLWRKVELPLLEALQWREPSHG